jgi:hypothetical protein
VEEKVILDFLLALQTQNFIRAEQILNNSIQKE